MRVVIAGGHGQIALRLERQLAEAGHEAVGLVRNPDHVPDLEKVGARGVVLDLERASAAALARRYTWKTSSLSGSAWSVPIEETIR